MVNPFDKTFFKFLFGFILILAVSFTILYFVNTASETVSPTPETLTAGQK
ncbi:MAG: hypothetical protein KGJ35_00590 [Patescibacteria group bacterium]|nr:hypothetical protein [Patescibacteria group bacterium]